jgi:muramoyltetrapeptide carboxypeptidase
MIKPKVLSKGDTVAIVAPSSPILPENIAVAREAMEALGLKPVFYPSCHARHGHLAGEDALRAGDVNAAFADPEIKGVIALRGGYGTPRLLEMIDFDMIRRHPKVFLGYSDITGLHLPLNRLSDLITFHGPTAYGQPPLYPDNPYTFDWLKKNLMGNKALGLYQPPPGEPLTALQGGAATGRIVGGNLSLLTAALGSPYEIDTRGRILFIEEVHEYHYVMDRMLMSLDLSGKFRDAAGIILGTFHGCKAEEGYQGKVDLPLKTIFREILSKYDKPVLYNFRAGHVSPQFTIPLGVTVRIDGDEMTVDFLEAATVGDSSSE